MVPRHLLHSLRPGGGVPSFVTNMLGPSNSLQCLLAMRAIVEREEKEEKEK